MPRSVYWVSVNGSDITSALEPILISIEITDTDGGQADQLEIELDDEGGQIALPPTGASIQAGIMYEEEDGSPSGPPVQFEGKVDRPESVLSRGGGLTLRINAKSADLKGKPKEHKEKHHDKGKFSQVAKKFGQEAGLNVRFSGKKDVEREYWAMQGESFLNWGLRVSRELGLTFKVRGDQAIFAERSSGQSAGGQALQTIRAHRAFDADGTRIGNIISGTLSPSDDRQLWQKFDVRRYDPKQAKYVYEAIEAKGRAGGSVKHLNRFDHADTDSAKGRGGSNAAESDRDQGGGTITLDGETAAQAECPCVVSGWRPGIDGTYRVKTARHKLTRSAGYTTELELKQPGGEAGKDGRGGSK